MVTLRLVELDVNGNIKESIVIRPDSPSAISDTIACASFDLGFPDISAAVYGLTEGNGTEDLTRFHGASTVSLDLVLFGPDKESWFSRLRAVCHPNKRVYLYVNRPEWDGERRMQLRANTFTFVSDRTSAALWKLTLSWSNPSGRLSAVDKSTITVTNPQTSEDVPPTDHATGGYGSGAYSDGLYGNTPGTSGLMTLERPLSLSRIFGLDDAQTVVPPDTPTTFGYSRGGYGSGNYGSDSMEADVPGDNIIYATVKGTADVLPVIKITGACTSPQIVFDAINTRIYLPELVIGAGDYLLIDVPSRSVLLNGDFYSSLYSYMSLSRTLGWNGWPYLITGPNKIVFNASSSDSACSMTVTWSDQWI